MIRLGIYRIFSGLIILSVMILALTPRYISAQSTTDDWQYWLFDTQTAQLMILSPNGITHEIDLPTFTDIEAERIQNPKLSPDGHTLAFEVLFLRENQWVDRTAIWLADLETQTCCQELTYPENPSLDQFHLGPFSPDGSQLVVSTGIADLSMEPMVLVYDVATNTVVYSLEANDLRFPIEFHAEFDSFHTAVFNEWSADGIRLAGSCTNCPASFIFFDTAQLWQPDTGEMSDPVAVTTDPLSILATGELIIATFDEDQPGGDADPLGIGEGVGLIYPSNVVRYYPDHSQLDPEVIFNQSEAPMIRSVHWVINGEAVIVFPDYIPQSSDLQRPILLYRDGEQEILEFFFDDQFFAPTPDGWLMCHFDGEQINILHYALSDDIYLPTEIATFDDYNACYYLQIVGQNFVLGEGLDAPPFTSP